MTSAQIGQREQRVIRVFVSSTFRDMQAERDYLVKFTFPQLRKLCESRSVTWGEVDLRWGVTDEQKAEVIERGQTVINSIQMKELSDILEFLDEDIFIDEKQNFYLCIDKLDEQWIDDKFRYLLIRSLIETLRDFIKVTNVKPIIALRNDLIERVFRLTRDAGFQC